MGENRLSRILIADDNPDIHEDIKYILGFSSPARQEFDIQQLKNELFDEEAPTETADASVSYRIDDAFQGEEAIEKVLGALGAGDPYALIFMDVRMPPGMDGIQAISKIWEADPEVEVVICTAYSDYSWGQIIGKFGHNDHLLFLRKPFDNVSVKQMALSMTTKWKLRGQVRQHIDHLEEEVTKRTSQLQNAVNKLMDEISLRKEKERQLAHNAHYDTLTELLNRRSFYEFISRILKNQETAPEGKESAGDAFSVLFIDIDGFKNVNDVYGHDVGDRLLTGVSDRLKLILQDVAYQLQSPEESCLKGIFRIGGDEFIAVLSVGDHGEIEKIAQMLLREISAPYTVLDYTVNISCSVGISIYPEDGIYSDMLFKYADMAMYDAKKTKNMYAFHKGPAEGSLPT